jgi:solute carrier family 35 protein
MLTAILLIYFNKAAFHYYSFNAPNLLTLTQTVVSLAFLYSLRASDWISFQSFTIQRFRRLLPIGLAFLGYMILGMISMKYVSVPIYTTLRRTTVCFVMIFEYYLVGKTASRHIIFAVGLMLLGALIAGVRDLHFDLYSYFLLFGYNFFTAVYLVLINRVTTEEKNIEYEMKLNGVKYNAISKYDLQYYNNLINLPFLLVIILCTGEWKSFLASPFLPQIGFQLALLGSSLLAFVLNVAIFWNTAVNSALTQTVSGQAKDIVVIMLGYWAFDDATMDIYSFFGVFLGFAGGAYYAYVKLKESTGNEHRK